MGTSAPTSDGTSAETVTADDLMVIKSQAAVENAPYTRYSCWHCADPPCKNECPFGAIVKDATHGGVRVDHSQCNPFHIKCTRQCLRNCMRGGYPKIGLGDGSSYKAWKCNFCLDWSTGATKWLPGHIRQAVTSSALDPTIVGASNYNPADGVPACVAACPANALKFGNVSDVQAVLETSAIKSWAGDGSMYWAISSKAAVMMPTIFAPPTADPFSEDHVVPMVQGALASPAGKALVLPTLATAGLYALYKRKVELAESK
jgi:Fe-S-cluster-containing dehydrogenase component